MTALFCAAASRVRSKWYTYNTLESSIRVVSQRKVSCCMHVHSNITPSNVMPSRNPFVHDYFRPSARFTTGVFDHVVAASKRPRTHADRQNSQTFKVGGAFALQRTTSPEKECRPSLLDYNAFDLASPGRCTASTGLGAGSLSASERYETGRLWGERRTGRASGGWG